MSSKSSWNRSHNGLESSRRRSQRVVISLPITVSIEDRLGETPFEEATHTLVVNAHGALIVLAAKVEMGQTIRLTNRSTRGEQKCRVAYVGKAASGKAEVGVEFKDPSPEFWQIVFPPEDWAAAGLEPATNKAKKS